jgi:hypothetical protein
MVAISFGGDTPGEALLRWAPGEDWSAVAVAVGAGQAPAADRLAVRGDMTLWCPADGPRYSLGDGFRAASAD